jgi:hypothetical protein
VTNVKVTGNGLALAITATVNTGGENTTCSVSVSGGGSASGACDGTISVGVPMYNTSYSVTFTATNAAGHGGGTGSAKSGLKALTADASTAFGSCPSSNGYCGGDSHMEPTPNFAPNNGAPLVHQGSQESADCWTTGGPDKGNVAPYNTNVNQWVHLVNSPGPGYMSILWFGSPNSVTSGLPKC